MAEQEHKYEALYQSDMLDSAQCSCGWKCERWYYDGREYAHYEWQQHAKGLRPHPAWAASFPSTQSTKD